MISSYKKKLFISKIYKIFKKKENLFRTLMYHSVFDEKTEDKPNQLYHLKLSIFKEQIKYIKNNLGKRFYKTDTLLNECPENGITITFDDGYLNTYEIASKYLLEDNIPFTIFVITDFIKNEKKEFMNKSMIKELSNNKLVTIGSHSVSHPKLSKLNDRSIYNEVNYSKLYLEDLLGKEITSLSYPHGDYDNRVLKEVKNAGYKLAFSSKFDANKNNENKFKLSRNEIWNTDTIEIFKQKIEGHWDWLSYKDYK